MINPNRKLLSLGLGVLACTAVTVSLTGCGGEEPAPVVAAPTVPPAPPPPPAPTITPIEQLMDELNIDKRVVLHEEQAPDNDEDRRAVLVFFDAIARGNSQALRGMLPLADQLELNALVESGSWQDTVSNIQRIELQTGTNSLSQKCALAVVEVGTGINMNFQPQLWYYTTDNDQPLFEAAPAPPGILDRLSGDWIASWHQILEAEIAMADKPDEDLTLAKRSLEDESEGSGSQQQQNPGSGAPDGPGRAPGARDPSNPNPTKAPGI